MNLTRADVDYLRLADVWFRDFTTGEEVTATVPFGRKLFRIDGDVLTVRSRHLRADIRVERPPHRESLTVVIPWSDRRFQCTTKDIGIPATGTITCNGRTYRPTNASLDFGRGKWPYRMTWNWGAGARADGSLAIQLGGKWTDGTGMTENALVGPDGRLTKIGDELTWTYDRADWLRPWRVEGPTVDLTFTPVHDKVGRLNVGIAASATDQCFGTWDGHVAGTAVEGLFGWAEEASWRW